MTTKPLSKKAITAELWRRGDLTYKFNEVQVQLHDIFEKDTRRIIPILVSRQTGKTFYLLCRAIMQCIKKDFAVVKFLQPTQKELKKTCRQVMRVILQDCPESLKPEWRENDKIYLFPNGSEIQLAGSDGKQYESLRGGSSQECYVDEAGFCDDLHDAIFSVLRPTTITTKGKIFLASTPSKLATHSFIQDFVLPAKAGKKLEVFTIHDNPMIDEIERKSIIHDYMNGEQNPEYRREYLCEIIQDENSVVIPEFTQEIENECIVNRVKPKFYDAYLSMDIGFRHLTVVLFAYYDFFEAKLVICDELVMFGPALLSSSLAKEINQKEHENFVDEFGEDKRIFMRVADNNNLILLNDLAVDHNLHFMATAKDDKEAQINQLRMMVNQKKIIISPKCKHLIYHLRGASWDKNRKKFNELPDIIEQGIRGGHADALDALIYLVRNLARHHNPYPTNWDHAPNRFFNKLKQKNDNDFMEVLKKMMNIRQK